MNGRRPSNFLENFANSAGETNEIKLPLKGSLPGWLHGVLIRNGPAQFTLEQEALHHWFDGFAMLSRFAFQNGQIQYSNRFILSEAYRRGNQRGLIGSEEFASSPRRGRLGRWLALLAPPRPTDNTNVNIVRMGEAWVALTETCRYWRFDPDTLETLGRFQFEDRFPGVITTAHPQYDFVRQALYNFTIQLGARHYYHFYRLQAGQKKRECVARIPVRQPAYMHSFACTERYLILIEPPLVLQLGQLLLRRKPFIENYAWRPELGLRFTVVDKENGAVVCQCESEAGFLFHQINAFEQEPELIIDVPVFADAKIIEALYLKNLQTQPTPSAKPVRYRIHLQEKKVRAEPLADCRLELPNVHHRAHSARPYRFAYAVSQRAPGDFLNGLVKLDVSAGREWAWYEESCYPGEPVFVAKPGLRAEDEGVILSLVYDARDERSFLLVLDAGSWQELARARLPLRVPFGFHGQFFGG